MDNLEVSMSLFELTNFMLQPYLLCFRFKSKLQFYNTHFKFLFVFCTNCGTSVLMIIIVTIVIVTVNKVPKTLEHVYKATHCLPLNATYSLPGFKPTLIDFKPVVTTTRPRSQGRKSLLLIGSDE